MKLWTQYRKFLDRREMKYGKDQMIEDAIKDANRANLFDFSETGDLSIDASRKTLLDGGIRKPSQQKTPTVLDLDNFFLPFKTCVAEFSIPGEEDGNKMEDKVGRLGGRVLGLVGRPEGQTVGFRGFDWPVMIVSQPAELPHAFRILKVVISDPVKSAYSQTRSETLPFGRTETRLNVFLYSCCDYEINSGKCLYAWNYTDKDTIFSKELQELDDAKREREHLRTAAGHYAGWTLAMLETANSPANWVVRVSEEHARVVKRRGKKVKEKRTRLIVVPDRDLDKVIKQSSGASDYIEKSPHRRRAHYRRLMSPRYRLKRGQRIFVKESWIGPKEAMYGGEKYEVLTSLPSRQSDVA